MKDSTEKAPEEPAADLRLSVSHISPGDWLECRTAFGSHLWMEAVTLPMRGDKFPVVWVKHAQSGKGVPWPLDAIRAIRKKDWAAK